MSVKYTEKWTRRLKGDYTTLYNKLIKASHMVSAETRDELIEALTAIGNAINEISTKVEGGNDE